MGEGTTLGRGVGEREGMPTLVMIAEKTGTPQAAVFGMPFVPDARFVALAAFFCSSKVHALKPPTALTAVDAASCLEIF